MQPAHRRQDRGNSVGALHPEKVLSKAFRTRVRFPPPPPKRKGRTSVRPFLFASMGYWSEPASTPRQWIWRRRASSAGLDSRLHFFAPLFLFMAMLPNRTCLHRVSDGYGGVSRRRRVSIPLKLHSVLILLSNRIPLNRFIQYIHIHINPRMQRSSKFQNEALQAHSRRFIILHFNHNINAK